MRVHLTLSSALPPFFVMDALLRFVPTDPPLYACPLLLGFCRNVVMCSIIFALLPLSLMSNSAHTCFNTSPWYRSKRSVALSANSFS